MKYVILLITLLLSFTILAQEKYIMLKRLSWDELQLYQLDSLLTEEELNLQKTCPTTLKKLQETYEKTGAHFQHILGTNYIWSEYTNTKGLRCFVKHKNIDSITPKDNEIINPNHYELLNTTQARVLKSASQGAGFKEKDLYAHAKEIRLYNQQISEKDYEKYGGKQEILNYMEAHQPTSKINPKLLKNRTTIENGTVITKHLKLIQIFELRYSEEQKNELINIVKKKLKKF